jgi:uncharacterized protein (DUF2141 family)
METKIRVIAISLLVALFCLSFQSKLNGTLTVKVTNIRSTKGEIEFALFNKSDGFGTDVTKAYKRIRGKITNGTCDISFDNIPYGQYAVEIYHDENDNNKFDETWYGMPKEGVAVSENPSLGIFSPPKFETAKFYFDATKNNISIKIKYL